MDGLMKDGWMMDGWMDGWMDNLKSKKTHNTENWRK